MTTHKMGLTFTYTKPNKKNVNNANNVPKQYIKMNMNLKINTFNQTNYNNPMNSIIYNTNTGCSSC